VKAAPPVKMASSSGPRKAGVPVTQQTMAPALPTVEIIRGEKRSSEVIK
jgi:hypothetical protein